MLTQPVPKLKTIFPSARARARKSIQKYACWGACVIVAMESQPLMPCHAKFWQNKSLGPQDAPAKMMAATLAPSILL